METTFNGFTAEFMEQVKEIKGVRKEQSKEEKRAGFELRMRRKDEKTNRERPSTHQQVEKHLHKKTTRYQAETTVRDDLRGKINEQRAAETRETNWCRCGGRKRETRDQSTSTHPTIEGDKEDPLEKEWRRRVEEDEIEPEQQEIRPQGQTQHKEQ